MNGAHLVKIGSKDCTKKLRSDGPIFHIGLHRVLAQRVNDAIELVREIPSLPRPRWDRIYWLECKLLAELETDKLARAFARDLIKPLKEHAWKMRNGTQFHRSRRSIDLRSEIAVRIGWIFRDAGLPLSTYEDFPDKNFVDDSTLFTYAPPHGRKITAGRAAR